MAYPFEDKGNPDDKYTKGTTLPATSRLANPGIIGKKEARQAEGKPEQEEDEVDAILRSRGMFCKNCGSL